MRVRLFHHWAACVVNLFVTHVVRPTDVDSLVCFLRQYGKIVSHVGASFTYDTDRRSGNVPRRGYVTTRRGYCPGCLAPRSLAPHHPQSSFAPLSFFSLFRQWLWCLSRAVICRIRARICLCCAWMIIRRDTQSHMPDIIPDGDDACGNPGSCRGQILVGPADTTSVPSRSFWYM